jgi:chromosome partitioning protein
MGWVVSIGGQKGGSGKSTVAQGLAVEAVRNGATAILADMDEQQQTSVRWAERRKQAGIQPRIDARLLRAVVGIGALRRLCDLLVIDTPSRADVTTLNVAKASDLMILTTDTNVFELEPTVMLMHELRAAGITNVKAVITLNKVLDAKREAEARSYLAQAGYEALRVPLMFNRATHDIGNEGLAVTEARQEQVAEQARQFFHEITEALGRAREGKTGGQEQDRARNEQERDQGGHER